MHMHASAHAYARAHTQMLTSVHTRARAAQRAKKPPHRLALVTLPYSSLVPPQNLLHIPKFQDPPKHGTPFTAALHNRLPRPSLHASAAALAVCAAHTSTAGAAGTPG